MWWTMAHSAETQNKDHNLNKQHKISNFGPRGFQLEEPSREILRPEML